MLSFIVLWLENLQCVVWWTLDFKLNGGKGCVLFRKRMRSVSSCGVQEEWRRLVKNIGWANQNIGGQKVVK